MLRSSRNKLTIHLRPTRVTIVEAKLEGRQVSDNSIDLPVAWQETVSWSEPLDVLEQWLQENKRTGSHVALHVADAYARYALIPWPVDIVREAELATYSKVYFEELFGSGFENWDIKVDWRQYGKAGVGCAIEAGFVDRAKQLLARHKLSLASLNTHFVNVYNAWQDTIKQSDSLLAVADAGQCVLATFKNRAWHSIRSVKVQSQASEQTSLLVAREMLLQGLAHDAPIHIHSDDPIVVEEVRSLGKNVVHVNDSQTLRKPASFKTRKSGKK